ncbi:hypothetical protein GALMADRAFT_219392 [Galerina marginata CBS 339.88]|uniref:DNA replication factor Cdt1 C-terminal domain-containing protein n=1 Tax=Galerina marginata (strain CBS 339.88) TaxID=685588 RepID=A0A067TKA5_GALM3|nr:hypothetical protein GALMADRAFT_219392 [Galerina marginata CBS 339.88]
MSDLYTPLQVSPRKKRCPPEHDDENTMTPKKLRIAPPTPPPSVSRPDPALSASRRFLPVSLKRLYNLQTALQHALSHALATCAISPTSDSGHVKNVLNHLSIVTYAGFKSSFDVDDLRRLCWLWEWDGKSLHSGKSKAGEDEDNPFLAGPASNPPSTDWTRGSMGIILSPATYFSKVNRKRVPAYGIGIEVEMDIDKDMGSGMAAVARWTAGAENRRSEFHVKLETWEKLHDGSLPLPNIPLADLPDLSAPKVSTLTRTLASCSPSTASTVKLPGPPSSPSRSPTKKPTRDFVVPFPTTLASKSPSKRSTFLFPQTPSRQDRIIAPGSGSSSEPPQTPSTTSSPSKDYSVPSTPVHQRGDKDSPFQTPSASRRQALYERVRQRSISASPTKTPRQEALMGNISPSKMTRDQMLKLQQDELRRRCLLGRLGSVAESIWMLFSNSTPGSSSTPARKRRALPTSDVITAVVKSSSVPISTSEANESISMLVKLCPFFLKRLDISSEEWLEMPAPTVSTTSATESSPSKSKAAVPHSPGRVKGKDESAQELITRSPRRVKRETGGLREVREIIRRELELQD